MIWVFHLLAQLHSRFCQIPISPSRTKIKANQTQVSEQTNHPVHVLKVNLLPSVIITSTLTLLSRRWSNRFDSDTAAVRQFEQRVNDALVVTSRAALSNAEPPQQTREFGVTRPLSRVPRIFEEQVPPPLDKSKMTPNSSETSDVSLSRSSNTGEP